MISTETGKIVEVPPAPGPIECGMDYTDALRPLFTLAAHAVRSVPDMPTGERLALRRELDALLAEAGTRARPSRPELFETARRAVRSWLDERFPGPAGSVAAADFYPSLERLLDAPDHHRHDAERRQAIEVFATCLELGYRGTNGVTDGFPAPAAFLRRCRRELAGAAFAPAVPPPLQIGRAHV